MAKAKSSKKTETPEVQQRIRHLPDTLDARPFFGLELDDEQRAFRDAIWSQDKLIVLCNAKAGTGKTTIAVMTAQLLYLDNRYDGIVYITAPVQEERIGFLPGTAEDKTLVYCEPFYAAALKAGINTYTAVKQEQDAMSQKCGTAYIDCRSHNYLRGITFENKVVIIEEAQNFYVDELKKTLTRISDNCKTIVIGHTGQCDLLKHPERAGFDRCLNLFRDKPFAQICCLTHNYRGVVSSTADEL